MSVCKRIEIGQKSTHSSFFIEMSINISHQWSLVAAGILGAMSIYSLFVFLLWHAVYLLPMDR